MKDQIEKQAIEEMALIICGFKDCTSCISRMGLRKCGAKAYAERFYKADYRKQEWISVDERLPEDSMTVITCNAKGEVDADYYAYWGLGFTDKTVTHWMPLPEPPKMKGGEE